jgi:endonuclease/exonuclease/phosphatase family metal-dependent hydrolase
MLADGLKSLDPEGTNDVILCLGEMRGPREVSNLVQRIGRAGLKVAVVSRYRRRDRFDMQQNAIATTLPVTEARWSRWKSKKGVLPPRGYAFAAVAVDPATTANVYAVHLKSNYGQGRDPERIADNRSKREASIRQIIETESRRDRPARAVIIAGDFNADRWRREFSGETSFRELEKAGFSDIARSLPENLRFTHPNRRHGNSLLDYIFCRGLKQSGTPLTVSSRELSDHMPLFAVLETLPEEPASVNPRRRARRE